MQSIDPNIKAQSQQERIHLTHKKKKKQQKKRMEKIKKKNL